MSEIDKNKNVEKNNALLDKNKHPLKVDLEETSQLGRRLTITVPAERIDQEVDKKLANLVKTVKVSGFRAGHVPLSVVEQKYGPDIRDEVLHDLMPTTLYEAIVEHKLNPAGRPHINHDHDHHPAQGEALKFSADFEVFPVIKNIQSEGFQIEKTVATVTDADLEKTLTSIAKQHATWESVNTPAAKGDQVLMDFTGYLDGELLENGAGKDFRLELGSGSFIADLEEGLIGATANQDLTIKATFPADYHAAAIAGKTAEFKVKVHEVAAPKLPELNDAFAEQLQIKEGGITKLRTEVRKNLERELKEVLHHSLRQKITDALLKANPIEIPQALVQEESQRLQKEMHERMGKQLDFDAFVKAAGDGFHEQARRRVALGLLMSTFIEQQAIKADDDKVKARIDELSSSYEKPEELVKWFYQDKNRLEEINAYVLEQQVIEKILSTAKVTEKVQTFEEVMPKRG
jgi:trigger factor